jgi:hypothetical protein
VQSNLPLSDVREAAAEICNIVGADQIVVQVDTHGYVSAMAWGLPIGENRKATYEHVGGYRQHRTLEDLIEGARAWVVNRDSNKMTAADLGLPKSVFSTDENGRLVFNLNTNQAAE